VGRFKSRERQIEIVETIHYPGNVTLLPNVIQGLLEISFNFGLESPSTAPTTIAQGFYNGQSLGIAHIHKRTDILPKHTLVSACYQFQQLPYSFEELHCFPLVCA